MSNVKTREIKTKFSIDGEKQLKIALSENAAQAKELKSEMALLNAQFEDNTESEEYLAQKGELLSRQTQNAQEKVSLYSGALEKARERQQQLAQEVEQSKQALQQQQAALEVARAKYGDGSEQVEKLTQEVEFNKVAVANQKEELSKANVALSKYKTDSNYAKTAQTRLENSTKKLTSSEKENTAQVAKMNDEMDDSADVTDLLDKSAKSLASKLGVDLPDGVSIATGSISSMSAGITAATAVVTALVTAVVEAGKKLIEISKESGEWAVEMEKLSAQTGMSTERIQELDYAAGMYGVKVEKIADSTKDLSQSLANAEDPTSEEAKLFRELGISIKNADGTIKSAGEVWESLIGRLSRIEDRTRQAAIANTLMGESYFDLQPILQDYSGFMETVNSVEAKNAALRDEEIDGLVTVNAAFGKLQSTLDRIRRAVAAESMEDLVAAIDQMNDVVGELGDYLIDSGAVKSLSKYMELLAGVVNLYTQLIDNVPGIEVFFNAVNSALDKMIRGLEVITKTLDMIISKSDKVSSVLAGPKGTIASGIYNIARDYIQGRRTGYASGTPSVSYGGFYDVGEHGPERVFLPRGASVMNARDTASAAGGSTYITLNVSVPNLETLNEIIHFYENYQITKRMG